MSGMLRGAPLCTGLLTEDTYKSVQRPPPSDSTAVQPLLQTMQGRTAQQ